MIGGVCRRLRQAAAMLSVGGGAVRWRLLTAVVAACLGSTAFTRAAQAYDQTFTPNNVGQQPAWLIPAMNASTAESHQLARHWPSNTAFWDVGGVPVYVGTPAQLDAMGQRKVERSMQSGCDWGIHRPHAVYLLTAIKCPRSAHFHDGLYTTAPVKTAEVTFIHEVLEYLADPAFPDNKTRVDGHVVEVCDYVYQYSRYDRAHRAWIPDFVYPSFFTRGKGPYDYFGKLAGPITPGTRDIARDPDRLGRAQSPILSWKAR
jgi:hypothetical protein